MRKIVLIFMAVVSIGLSTLVSAYTGDLPVQAIPLSGITVDGKLDDWPANTPSYPIDWVWPHGDPLKGESDFKGTFAVGYDAERRGLFVAVIVVDDSFASYGKAWNERDRCEIYINGDYGSGSVIEYWMSGTDGPITDSHSPVYLEGVKAAFLHQKEHGKIPFIKDDVTDKGVYIYEWFIPVQDDNRHPIPLRPGTFVGFDVAICDKDEDGSFSWFTWRLGSSRFWMPELVGRVLITKVYDPDLTSKMGLVSGKVFLGGDDSPVTVVALQGNRLVGSTLTDHGGYSIYLFPGKYIIKAGENSISMPMSVEVKAGAEKSGTNIFSIKAGKVKAPSIQQAGGGGGPVPGWLIGNFDDLNKEIEAMGLPTFDKGMFLMGGKGYGRIKHFIIGGAGYGGTLETNDVIKGSFRSARIDLAYGSVILGLSLRSPKWEASLGGSIGGGNIKITRVRNSRTIPSWNEVWGVYNKDYDQDIPNNEINVRSELTANFLVLEPFVELKYWFLPFAAIDLTAGYLRAEVGKGKWEEDGVKVAGSPKMDFSGPSVKLGIHFGL